MEPFPWDVAALLRRAPAPERLPMGGVIVRGALSDAEQRHLYEALYALADHTSAEIQGLRATATAAQLAKHNPDNRPQPFVTWVHPYTRASNASERPTRLLEWAERLMHALVPESSSHIVDSMLAQMYAGGGSLLRHCDEDLSWGLGVSLGGSADFDCLPDTPREQRVTIRSGDLIVGEFGQMAHAVRVPNGAAPRWWRSVDTFGAKLRCNVLFRQALTKKQQRKLAEERSLAVYGIPLAELRKRTGHDDAFLSVHLRHAAKE